METTVVEQAVVELVDRFNAAWNAHDLEAAIALTTDDCIFESTSPAPDGQPACGHDELRAAWQPIFDDSDAHFTTERSFVAGDRLVQQWRYSWDGGHIRGVDIIEVRGGLVSAKLAYVKG